MKKQIGMTLIELMVAITLLVILVGIAVPSMKSFLDNKNLSVVGPIFEKSMQLARSETIQRSRTIRVSPTSGTGDWSQGWRIEAVNGPNPADLELIRIFDALPGNPIFTSATFNGVTLLEFLPNGQASTLGSFTLHYADCSGGKGYNYDLLVSGVLKRSDAACP